MQKTINYLKVVVIGYGSVGKRHVQNLLKIPNTKIIIYTKQKIPSISFGNKKIGGDSPVLVIAEIGVNHEGNVEICAKMIEEAARVGADAVKLQTFDPSEH